MLFRSIIREAAGRINAFDSKGDDSPVTEIDRRVETELRRRIGEAFPEHGIQGEEFGAQATGADYVWVLDPIDGTKAFVAGIPVFGTLIALAHRGVPVLGVIDQPMTRERWIGADGFPTTLNGTRVATSGRTVLSEAVLSTSNIELYDPASLPVFEALRSSVHWCVYGGSCYAYGRLASGGIDVAIEQVVYFPPQPFAPELVAAIRDVAVHGLVELADGKRVVLLDDEEARWIKHYLPGLRGLAKGEAKKLGTLPRLIAPMASLEGFRDQDLRDTAVTWLALAGATLPEIASVTGHSLQSIHDVLKHYLARHPEMAEHAIAKLVEWHG